MSIYKNGSAKKRFEEAMRFFKNGKTFLKDAKVSYELYEDTKPVHEACGIAYLAMLKSIEGYLIEKGIEIKELPHSFEGIETTLKRHLVHNGKVRSAIYKAYQSLHISGYYHGNRSTVVIKSGFESAKFVIETLSHQKIS